MTETSIVRVAIFEEEDYEVLFSDIVEASETDEDIATISDFDIIALVARHMDITVEELNVKVYGSGHDGKRMIVSRPQTGRILIHPEMVLGLFKKKEQSEYDGKYCKACGKPTFIEIESSNAYNVETGEEIFIEIRHCPTSFKSSERSTVVDEHVTYF